MLDTLGVVHARTDTAQERRNAERTLGGKSILEWIVRRASECQQLDAIVVVLSESADFDGLARLVPPGIEVFRAGQPDSLSRVVELLDELPARGVVRIGLESPFVDPVLIDRLASTAAAHPASDYIGYCTRDGHPAVLSQLGLFAEWCAASALVQANSEATALSDRCQVTPYIYSHPESFSLRLIPMPVELESDVRRALDLDRNWEYVQTVFESLGHDRLDWKRIAGLLDAAGADTFDSAVG